MIAAPLIPPQTLWLVGLGETGLAGLAEAMAARRRTDGTACVVLHGDPVENGLTSADPAARPAGRLEQVHRAAEMARLCNQGGAWAVISIESYRLADLQPGRAIVGVEHCRVVCLHASTSDHGLALTRPAAIPLNETAGADTVIDITCMSQDEAADAVWKAWSLQVKPSLTHETPPPDADTGGAAASIPSELPYQQSLESWLQRAIERGDYAASDIAAAMVEDGYPDAQAHVLAVTALVRYGRTPLTQLFVEPTGRLDGHHLRRHLGAYLFGLPRDDGRPEPWDPTRQLTNRIVLRDRTVDMLAVAEHPRLAMLGGLLSTEECEALIEAARRKLQPDAVVLLETGEAAVNPDFRSSMGCGFQPGEFELLARIEARVSELLQWPPNRFEQTAISCYQRGARFGFHHDYFRKPPAPVDADFGPAGDRVATLVVYLSDVLEDGATAFSHLGLHVRPQRGHAVFFSYRCPDDTPDPASEHSGMPVAAGEKWIATFWLRAHPFPGCADAGASSATALAVAEVR